MPGNGLWPPPTAVYLANVGSTGLTAGAAVAAFSGHATAAGILATAAVATHAVNLLAGPMYSATAANKSAQSQAKAAPGAGGAGQV
jgi:hypothetical protein